MHCTPSSTDNPSPHPPVLLPFPGSNSTEKEAEASSIQHGHAHSIGAHDALCSQAASVIGPVAESVHYQHMHNPAPTSPDRTTLTPTSLQQAAPTVMSVSSQESYPPGKEGRHVWRSNPVALKTMPECTSQTRPSLSFQKLLSSLPTSAWHYVMGNSMSRSASDALAAMSDFSPVNSPEHADRKRISRHGPHHAAGKASETLTGASYRSLPPLV
jgi:hypothetical protein